MTRFHFERPDGPPSNDAQQILIHLNEFVPPQGYGGGGAVAKIHILAEDDISIIVEVDWFNVSFAQRIPQTINGGQVPSPQTDFPLAVHGTFPELIGFSKEELRFTGSDNIQLDYDIEDFDTVTGRLAAWPKKPTVDNGDMISTYFDNPLAVDESDPFTVWSTYGGVWHMNQLSFGSNTILDSTINANHGSTLGSPSAVLGKVGLGFRTNGDGGVTIPNSPSVNIGIGSFTLEMWLETFSTPNSFFGLLQKKFNFNNNEIGVLWATQFSANDSGLQLRLNDSTHQTDQLFDYPGSRTILQNNGFHHIGVTYDSLTKAVIQYIDGVPFASGTYTLGSGNFSNTEPLTFGATATPDYIFDEIRISAFVRPADYFITVFNNQNAPSTFFTTDAVESVPLTPLEIET